MTEGEERGAQGASLAARGALLYLLIGNTQRSPHNSPRPARVIYLIISLGGGGGGGGGVRGGARALRGRGGG